MHNRDKSTRARLRTHSIGRALAAGVVLSISTTSWVAHACRCTKSEDPAAARDAADVVVLVRVLSGPRTSTLSHGTYEWAVLGWELEVIARWKGERTVGARFEVFSEASSAACGREFTVGEEMLMFASESPQGIVTDTACSHTRTRAAAKEAGDLEKLGRDLDGAIVPEPAPAEPAKPSHGAAGADDDAAPPALPPVHRGCTVADGGTSTPRNASAWMLVLALAAGVTRRRSSPRA